MYFYVNNYVNKFQQFLQYLFSFFSSEKFTTIERLNFPQTWQIRGRQTEFSNTSVTLFLFDLSHMLSVGWSFCFAVVVAFLLLTAEFLPFTLRNFAAVLFSCKTELSCNHSSSFSSRQVSSTRSDGCYIKGDR